MDDFSKDVSNARFDNKVVIAHFDLKKMVQYTPFSSLTILNIKHYAKKIKKEHGITHTQALNMVAKDLGYHNWIDCQRKLKGDG